LGNLHPAIEAELDFKAPVYIAELYFDKMVKHAEPIPSYTKFGRYPHVYKDISMIMPSTTVSGDLIADIYSSGGKLVKDVILYDKYTGSGIEDGHISLTFRILFMDDDATLTDDAVNPILMNIAKGLEERFGAKLR
jgi:phenylalanyl-tRNA synthetase beta chain